VGLRKKITPSQRVYLGEGSSTYRCQNGAWWGKNVSSTLGGRIRFTYSHVNEKDYPLGEGGHEYQGGGGGKKRGLLKDKT